MDGRLTPKHSVQRYVLGAILILLFLAVLSILYPFFSALLWASMLYILFRPLHRYFIRGLDFHSIRGKILGSLWAAVFTIGIMVIIFFPLSFVVVLFLRQMAELGGSLRDRLETNPEYLHSLVERFSGLVSDISAGQITFSVSSIEAEIKGFFSSELQGIVQFGSDVAKNIGGFVLNLLLVICSLFFLFLDGPYLGRLVQSVIPIRKDYLAAITTKFMDTTRALFFGYIIVAFIQGAVAFVIYAVFRVEGALVFAGLTFVLVFIPMAGGAVVYVPLAVMRIAGGDIAGGVVLFAVSVVFISGIDNLLRPYFLKDRIQLHPLIILLAILGGVIVFGFNGVILGPMLVIMFLTVLDLFLAEHKIKPHESRPRG